MTDVLIVGQIPPPYHGQSIMTSYLQQHDWGEMKVITLPLRYSDSLENVGRFSPRKIWILLFLLLRTWYLAFRDRPRVLYYLPASPNWVPVLRDYVYLKCVRWMFPKTIFHFHAGGLNEFIAKNGSVGHMLASCYHRPDVAIDVNRFDSHTGEFFQSVRNELVWNGVKVPDERCLQYSNSTGGRVLYLGLISAEKGFQKLLSLAMLLRDEAIEFHVVGSFADTLYEEQVRSFIKTNRLADTVLLKGAKYDAEKWEEYEKADIFIFPSEHPTETFGIVLAEAMAFGLPIVASDWRSTGNVVSAECAFLCPPAHENTFSEALCELSRNADLRKRMGKASAQRFEEKFTCESFLKAMESLFKRELNEE